MNALILILAMLEPFYLCCADLGDGQIACRDLSLDQAPECTWVTTCKLTDSGDYKCYRDEPFAGLTFKDFRCCPENGDDVVYSGCGTAGGLGLVPWCFDPDLAIAVTCDGEWVETAGEWDCID